MKAPSLFELGSGQIYRIDLNWREEAQVDLIRKLRNTSPGHAVLTASWLVA